VATWRRRESFRDGLAIRDRLAQADPATRAGSAICRGPTQDRDVLVGRQSAEALKTFRDGLGIAERLAQSDPGTRLAV